MELGVSNMDVIHKGPRLVRSAGETKEHTVFAGQAVMLWQQPQEDARINTPNPGKGENVEQALWKMESISDLGSLHSSSTKVFSASLQFSSTNSPVSILAVQLN